jgi:hypothetical protein
MRAASGQCKSSVRTSLYAQCQHRLPGHRNTSTRAALLMIERPAASRIAGARNDVIFSGRRHH